MQKFSSEQLMPRQTPQPIWLTILLLGWQKLQAALTH